MPNNDSDAPISYAFASPRIPIALKQRSGSEISIHRLTLDKRSVLPLQKLIKATPRAYQNPLYLTLDG